MSQGSDDDLTTVDEPQRAPVTQAELAFTGALLLIACAVAFLALGLSGRSAVWPQVLAGGFVLLTALDLVVVIRRYLARPDVERPRSSAVSSGDGRKRLAMCFWLVAFAWAGLQFGFGWATLVLLPVYQWVAGSRNLVRVGLVTIGVVAAFHLLFHNIASTPIW